MTKTLDEIMSGRGEAVPSDTPAPETNEAPPAKPEAPEANAPAPEPADAGKDEAPADGGMVPQAALHAERQKSRRYTEELAETRRRLEEMETRFQVQLAQIAAGFQQRQPPPPPEPVPDFWADPEQHQRRTTREEMQPVAAATLALARDIAELRYSPDEVRAAEEAFNAAAREGRIDPLEHQRINSSKNPWAAAVEWNRQRQVLSEVGSDPKAYREKLRAEIMAELQASRAPATTPAAPPPVMPSNFAGARSAAPNSAPTFTGPRALSEIMGR